MGFFINPLKYNELISPRPVHAWFVSEVKTWNQVKGELAETRMPEVAHGLRSRLLLCDTVHAF
jgi:hypothetical protein